MLPREQGRHRRLLRRNGSGRWPEQKQDTARRKTQSSGSAKDPSRISRMTQAVALRTHERDARAYIYYFLPFSHHSSAAPAAIPATARPARFIERSSSACRLSTCGFSGYAPSGFQRAFQCGCDYFGQVQGVAVGGLRDLFAAAEAVGDDQAVGRGLADRRQKLQLSDRHRDVILFFIEAERAGHAAAAWRGSAPVDAHFS